ncbi:MAG: STAS/SEC14 domain-containing protein [Pseudomonadota bacterium]
MPLSWTIDRDHRTVEIVAEGDVTLADAMAFFAAVEEARALPYKKLFNGARARAAMTADELLAAASRIRQQHGASAVGALAVVASREQAHLAARMLGAAAAADRPMRIFDDLRRARRWLDDQTAAAP